VTFADPVTLQGRVVRLEPLDLGRHWAGLVAVGLDPELWTLSPARVGSEADLRRWADQALSERARGVAQPFATVLAAGDRVVGSTRFAAFAPEHRRVEIGWTWVARPWQRTAVNTEAKYLMLCHAFEALGLRRVELKTDAMNHRSRAAMSRLGLVEEGLMRQHMLKEDGTSRDTAWFSVIDAEWPSVRARLERLLARGPA
jgi:RimJ/RimL family protein N-acetyltransferase